MSDSSDARLKRPVITYIIIAVALVAALILCVRWVKTRANSYVESQAQTGQSQTASSGDQESQPVTTDDPQTQQQQPTDTQIAAEPVQTTPALSGSIQSVPSTGPEQFVMTLIATSSIAFSAQSYIRARRRLQNLAR